LSLLETLRRKDFYVVLVLVFLLATWVVTMNPGGAGAGRFAKDIVMQVIWLASFALTAPLAARQISSDLEQKTIYVLMSRPIERWHYIFGRAAGAAVAAIVCFSSMFIALITMMFLKGTGVTDVSLWQAFALQIVALVMLCAVTVFFSITGSPAGAVTFSLLSVGIMRYGGYAMLDKIANMHGQWRGVIWAGYVILPHFEFFSISQRVVHGWGAMPTDLFVPVLIYGAAYSIFATAFAAYLFKRRWL